MISLIQSDYYELLPFRPGRLLLRSALPDRLDESRDGRVRSTPEAAVQNEQNPAFRVGIRELLQSVHRHWDSANQSLSRHSCDSERAKLTAGAKQQSRGRFRVCGFPRFVASTNGETACYVLEEQVQGPRERIGRGNSSAVAGDRSRRSRFSSRVDPLCLSRACCEPGELFNIVSPSFNSPLPRGNKSLIKCNFRFTLQWIIGTVVITIIVLSLSWFRFNIAFSISALGELPSLCSDLLLSDVFSHLTMSRNRSHRHSEGS